MTRPETGPERRTVAPSDTAHCWRCDEGEGARVVLVHGTMDRASSFGRVQRHLDDFRVTRYDRRGYGRSVELGPPTGMAQQVADLLDVVGDDPALVAGHSYGGTVALAAAAVAPDLVRGVVAYEAPMQWLPWWPRTSAGAQAVATSADPADAAERFMRRMVGDARWEKLPPSTRAARRAEGATLVAEMAHARPPNPPAFDPADLAVPVIAAHGTEGAEHHARSAAALADAAPMGELVVVQGAGHGVHLSHPKEFAALVRRLHRRVEGR